MNRSFASQRPWGRFELHAASMCMVRTQYLEQELWKAVSMMKATLSGPGDCGIRRGPSMRDGKKCRNAVLRFGTQARVRRGVPALLISPWYDGKLHGIGTQHFLSTDRCLSPNFEQEHFLFLGYQASPPPSFFAHFRF